ncbi:Hypothetical protein EHI5A_116970 [Entamoeba histolytica KU27]|uniref:TLDc domain-containing protein n=1 Tax=Entamoeba histolytica KU27 TaxID=885311 RepID=M2RYR3_ENTHI|nr:Hypothetical protein EHI5A_116970 [Entamoeba histolytica KU27]
MEELMNNKTIKEVIKTLPSIQQSIEETTKQYQYYLGSNKNEVFEKQENETFEEAIKRGEGIFDRMNEVVRRRRLVIEKGKTTMSKIEDIKNKMEVIMKDCSDDEETLGKAKNKIIDKIIKIEEMKMEDKVTKLEYEIQRINEEINYIKKEFKDKKEEWGKQYSDYPERKKRLENMKGMIKMEEMKELEEWTEKRFGNILFDSDKDDWNKNTSVFDRRIMNKEHIIIIIEDENGNKFGGYINSKIDKVICFINDPKSFLFSLESNGRIDGVFQGMKKFDIKEPQYTFYLCNQSHDYLFGFGNGEDIGVGKENYKTLSYCDQRSYEYEGISNALCGKQHPEHFTPKRIIAVEMK